MDPVGAFYKNRDELELLMQIRNLPLDRKIEIIKVLKQRLGGLPTGGPLDASPRETPPHMGKAKNPYEMQ